MKRVKRLILIVCIMAMLTPMSSSGAWLIDTSGADSTTMTKGYIDIVPFQGNANYALPSHVRFQNNGNTKAWLRVMVNVNWVNEDTGNWIDKGSTSNGRLIYAQSPRETDGTHVNGMPWTKDYTFPDWTADGHWLQGPQKGVYYYKTPVASNGGQTPELMKALTVHHSTMQAAVQGTARTFHLTVEFSVDAIQYEDPGRFSGTPAVVSEWGVTLNSSGTQIASVPSASFNPTVY